MKAGGWDRLSLITPCWQLLLLWAETSAGLLPQHLHVVRPCGHLVSSQHRVPRMSILRGSGITCPDSLSHMISFLLSSQACPGSHSIPSALITGLPRFKGRKLEPHHLKEE